MVDWRMDLLVFYLLCYSGFHVIWHTEFNCSRILNLLASRLLLKYHKWLLLGQSLVNCSSRACSFLPAIEPWVDPSIECVRQWLFRSLFSNVHSATDHGQYGKVTLSWNSQTYTFSCLEQWFFFHKFSNMSFNCLSRVTLSYCPYHALDTLFSFRSPRAPLLCSLWRQYLQSLSILQRAEEGII